MLIVFLKLVVMQPLLLLAHLENYANLLTAELQKSLMRWKLRLLLLALSAIFICLGLFCGFVALMLWAALPLLKPESEWVLVGLPVGLMLIGSMFLVIAQQFKLHAMFSDIQEQLSLDLQALRQAHHR